MIVYLQGINFLLLFQIIDLFIIKKYNILLNVMSLIFMKFYLMNQFIIKFFF